MEVYDRDGGWSGDAELDSMTELAEVTTEQAGAYVESGTLPTRPERQGLTPEQHAAGGIQDMSDVMERATGTAWPRDQVWEFDGVEVTEEEFQAAWQHFEETGERPDWGSSKREPQVPPGEQPPQSGAGIPGPTGAIRSSILIPALVGAVLALAAVVAVWAHRRS